MSVLICFFLQRVEACGTGQSHNLLVLLSPTIFAQDHLSDTRDIAHAGKINRHVTSTMHGYWSSRVAL